MGVKGENPKFRHFKLFLTVLLQAINLNYYSINILNHKFFLSFAILNFDELVVIHRFLVVFHCKVLECASIHVLIFV
jgi:hypothetical protein